MKLLFKFILPALLLPVCAMAQSNYKPGYVVTSKGDTLRGTINVKDWSSNPTDINFQDQSGVKNYTVADIKYFSVLNISYQRYAGKISVDETNLQRLSNGVDSSKKEDIVFLKIEQKGPKVVLFSYTDNIKTRFFIGDNQAGSIDELLYRIYFVPDRGTQTHNENGYVPQLYALAQKYNDRLEELKREIEKSAYNLDDLKSISAKINGMGSDKADYGSATAIRFFVGASANVSRYAFSGDSPFNNPPSKTSVSPLFSIGANIYTNPDVDKFVLRGEFSVTTGSYNSRVDIYYNSPNSLQGNYSFKQVIFSFNPQAIYNFYNTKAFKFYGDAGLAINIVKNSGNVMHNNDLNRDSRNYLTLNSNFFSGSVKAGIVLSDKIDIGITYVLSTSVTDNVKGGALPNMGNSNNYSLNLSGIRAGINYIFK